MSDTPAVQPPEEHAPLPVPASVTTVSVKIPPFWPADPVVCFAQVEAQFATRNITSQRTQFDHVVAALSNKFATEVRDIILSPPEVDAYSKLKDLLIKQTAASERKRLQLLSLRRNSATGSLHKSYGGCSSSWVTLLAPNRTTLSYGKYFSSGSPAMFARCWPPLGTLSLNTLADMADKMLEVAPPTMSSLVSPATAPTPTPPTPASSEVAQLRSEISELRQLISSLQLSTGRPSRSHSCSHSRSRASSPGPSSGLCWYHRRFGDKANKCTSPCSWQGNGQAYCYRQPALRAYHLVAYFYYGPDQSLALPGGYRCRGERYSPLLLW